MAEEEDDQTSHVQKWASDWADKFDQDWTEENLSAWVGKTVSAITPDGAHGFKAHIIGFGKLTLVVEDRQVHQFSFLTDEGLQVALFTKMQVEEVSE